jgi:predicted nucleotidyltransferase
MNGEPRIPLDQKKIRAFCEKWKIVEFSLFGSVLTDEFRPDSDVDVLVKFAPEVRWRISHWLDMQDELRALFGRDVDLLTRPDVEMMDNYIRRRSILSGASRIYAG